MNPLAAELRDERRARGVSQAKLASRIGVLNAQLCYWESGKRAPATHNLIAWANALGFDLVLQARAQR